MKIETVFTKNDVLKIIEEMKKDKSEFVENEEYILDAFNEQCVFLMKDENGELLPSCMITSRNKERCELIWVHSKYRRQGIGTTYVNDINIKTTSKKSKLGALFFKKFT